MAQHGYTTVANYGDMDKGSERLAVLKREPAVYAAYRALKDDSWAARYNMWRPAPGEVVDLRDNEFEAVKSFVLEKLA